MRVHEALGGELRREQPLAKVLLDRTPVVPTRGIQPTVADRQIREVKGGRAVDWPLLKVLTRVLVKKPGDALIAGNLKRCDVGRFSQEVCQREQDGQKGGKEKRHGHGVGGLLMANLLSGGL